MGIHFDRWMVVMFRGNTYQGIVTDEQEKAFGPFLKKLLVDKANGDEEVGAVHRVGDFQFLAEDIIGFYFCWRPDEEARKDEYVANITKMTDILKQEADSKGGA